MKPNYGLGFLMILIVGLFSMATISVQNSGDSKPAGVKPEAIPANFDNLAKWMKTTEKPNQAILLTWVLTANLSSDEQKHFSLISESHDGAKTTHGALEIKLQNLDFFTCLDGKEAIILAKGSGFLVLKNSGGKIDLEIGYGREETPKYRFPNVELKFHTTNGNIAYMQGKRTGNQFGMVVLAIHKSYYYIE